eukprot:SM000001S04431  [mRNA]  locus=s1:184501:185482:- [translate_table: standard]
MKVAPSTGAVAALLVLLLSRLAPSEAAPAVPPAAEDPSNDFVIFSEDQAWSYGQLALGNKALESDLPQPKQLQEAPAREAEKQDDVQEHSAGLRGGHYRRISKSQNPTVYEQTDGKIQKTVEQLNKIESALRALRRARKAIVLQLPPWTYRNREFLLHKPSSHNLIDSSN